MVCFLLGNRNLCMPVCVCSIYVQPGVYSLVSTSISISSFFLYLSFLSAMKDVNIFQPPCWPVNINQVGLTADLASSFSLLALEASISWAVSWALWRAGSLKCALIQAHADLCIFLVENPPGAPLLPVASLRAQLRRVPWASSHRLPPASSTAGFPEHPADQVSQWFAPESGSQVVLSSTGRFFVTWAPQFLVKASLSTGPIFPEAQTQSMQWGASYVSPFPIPSSLCSPLLVPKCLFSQINKSSSASWKIQIMPGDGASPSLLQGKSPARLSFPTTHTYTNTSVVCVCGQVHMLAIDKVEISAQSFVFSLILFWISSMAFNLLRNTIFKEINVLYSSLLNHCVLNEYLGWFRFALLLWIALQWSVCSLASLCLFTCIIFFYCSFAALE